MDYPALLRDLHPLDVPGVFYFFLAHRAEVASPPSSSTSKNKTELHGSARLLPRTPRRSASSALMDGTAGPMEQGRVIEEGPGIPRPVVGGIGWNLPVSTLS